MIIQNQESIKRTLKLEYQVLDFLIMRLLNIATCGEKLVNFQQKNIENKKIDTSVLEKNNKKIIEVRIKHSFVRLIKFSK